MLRYVHVTGIEPKSTEHCIQGIEYSVVHAYINHACIQWNLSIVGQENVSSLERCPYF